MSPAKGPPQRILVVLPNWLGDIVMATPTLRAVRVLFPDAHITVLVKRAFRAVLDHCPWIDRVLTVRDKNAVRGEQGRLRTRHTARRLRAGRFDLALLLPNSLRWAMIARLAGISRRVGYNRDHRGLLLTDRLQPAREAGAFVPVPTHTYYLDLARHLGARDVDPTLALFTAEADDEHAEVLLREAGHGPDQPLVILSPGANYGDAKMWFPDRFAAVGDTCIDRYGATVAVSGAPGERPLLDAVHAHSQHAFIDLPSIGIDLKRLKSVMKLASVVVANDTGSRHVAIAMGTPVVAIYGPTDPAWTKLDSELDHTVRIDVPCGPCQKKICPLLGADEELVCMKGVTVERVMGAIGGAIRSSSDQAM